MALSAALAADLTMLTQALGRDDVDLQTELGELAAELRRAVSSYLGLSVTITMNTGQISFGAGEDPRPLAAASLLIPLSVTANPRVETTLVLFAATPGAFVDLAADLAVVPGVGSSALVLDGHLSRLAGPADSVGMDGLPAYVTINRAIGVLVDRGHTPDAARRELHRRAESDGNRLPVVAEQVLRSVADAPREES